MSFKNNPDELLRNNYRVKKTSLVIIIKNIQLHLI